MSPQDLDAYEVEMQGFIHGALKICKGHLSAKAFLARM